MTAPSEESRLVVVRQDASAPVALGGLLRAVPVSPDDVDDVQTATPAWHVDLSLHRSGQVTRLAARFVAGRAAARGAALRVRFTAPLPPRNRVLRLPPLPLDEFGAVRTLGVELPRIGRDGWCYPCPDSTLVLSASGSDVAAPLALLQAIIDPDHCAADRQLLDLDDRVTPQLVDDCVAAHAAHVVAALSGEGELVAVVAL